MQTFLPYSDFMTSACYLDRRRLGKQRVECKQIWLALTDPSYGWQNHPAVRMWRGHEASLARYGFAMCSDWRARGYNDTLLGWFADRANFMGAAPTPSWLGRADFHLSHQSNLVRKDPAHYRRYWPYIPADLPYIWPVPTHIVPSGIMIGVTNDKPSSSKHQ